MGLQIRRAPRRRVHFLITVFAAFALVAQPLYGLVNMQVANALSTSGIVINEIAPATGDASKWVELYNTSSLPVGMGNWRFVRNGVNVGSPFAAGTSIAANGFYTVEITGSLPLDSASSPLHLMTGPPSTGIEADAVDYGVVPEGQSYGRQTDGDANFQVFSTPTKDASNGVQQALAIEPQLNAENFNTVDGNYKGISVGFNAKNFGTVTDVTVTLKRAIGGDIVKHGNQGVLDLISNKTTAVQLTAPFVIKDGTYKEVDDALYWEPAPATWTAAMQPTSVKISVTDENGTKTVTNSAFHQGAPSWPTFVSLIPTDVQPPVVDFVTPEGNVQNDLKVHVRVNDDNLLQVKFIVKRLSDNAVVNTKAAVPENGEAMLDLMGYDLCAYDRLNNCDASWVMDGKYQIRVLAYTSAGPSNTSTYRKLTVDTRAPDVNITSPLSGPVDGVVNISGTVTDDNLSHYYFAVRDENGIKIAGPGQVNNKPVVKDWQWDTTNVPDGVYTVILSARDKAGNKDDGSKEERAVVIDRTSSDGYFDVSGGTVSKDVSFKVHLHDNVSGLGAQQIVLRNSAGVAVGNWIYDVKTGNTRVITGNGSFSYTGNQHDGILTIAFDSAGLTGAYNLRLFTKDQSGNGRSNIYGQLNIDNTAPTVTMQLTSSATPSASTPISLKGSVNETNLQNLILKRDGEEIANLTADAKKDGTWSYTLQNGLPGGSYTFTVVATDVYGNVSQQTVNSTVALSVGAYASAGRSARVAGLASPSAPSLIVPGLFTAAATTPFTAPQLITTPDEDTAVLGTETTKNPAQSSDLPVVAATENGWKIFGIAWYWWALILAILTFGAWWTVASVRRRKAAELA